MDAPPDRLLTPYRDAPPPPASPPPPPPDDALDERALLWFLALVGAMRVGAVALARGPWDAETCTLGLLAFFSIRRLFAVERGLRRRDDPPR